MLAKVSPGSSIVEITFLPDGEGTLIRVRHSGLPRDDAVVHIVGWGWETYTARLAVALAGGNPGVDPAIALIEGAPSEAS